MKEKIAIITKFIIEFIGIGNKLNELYNTLN